MKLVILALLCASCTALTCNKCIAKDASGCEASGSNDTCTGDVCVDFSQGGGYARGCVTLLKGSKDLLPSLANGDICDAVDTKDTSATACFCKSGDKCNTGKITKPTKGKYTCVLGDNSTCTGNGCIWSEEDDYKGCLTIAGKFNILPIGPVSNSFKGCLKMDAFGSGEDLCQCTSDNCNNKEPSTPKYGKGSVTCVDSTGSSKTCKGDYCVITDYFGQTDQSCVQAEDDIDLACISAVLPSKIGTKKTCLCKTDNCNKDFDSAMSSIPDSGGKKGATSVVASAFVVMAVILLRLQ